MPAFNFVKSASVALVLVSVLGLVHDVKGALISTTFVPGLDQSVQVFGSPPQGSANCCGVPDDNLSTGLQISQTYSGRGVFRFDSVSTTGTKDIISATVRLYRTGRQGNASTQLFRLTSAFDATPFPIAGHGSPTFTSNATGQALYQLADGVAGNPSGLAIGTLANSPASGYIDIDVTSVVLAWQAANYANAFGFGITGYEISNATPGGGDFFSGALSANPPQLVVVTFAVPEPSTFALLGLGLVGAAIRTRRRRRMANSTL